MNMSNEKEIISAVKAMREAQKEYFRTRNYETLQKSKWLESKVDKLLTDYYESKQATLF